MCVAPDVRHQRRAQGREAAFGMSAWRRGLGGIRIRALGFRLATRWGQRWLREGQRES